MKIVICGEVYSGNLGDPIIAAGLVEILRRVDSAVEVELFDFSGRAGVQQSTNRKAAAPTLRQRLNRSLRGLGEGGRRISNRLHWNLGERARLAASCARVLPQADAVVIGGGQLLMDNDLSFPLRVREVVRAAHAARIPVAFHACGIGAVWSRTAISLMNGALGDSAVAWISARDRLSLATLESRFRSSAVAGSLCPDPALWSAEAYGTSRATDGATVGVVVMEPELMKRHLDGPGQKADDKAWLAFWSRVVEGLLRDGRRIEMFTNGSLEDEAFADRVYAGVSHSNLVRLERPRGAAELVAYIARQAGVVAARLHTGIVAYSLGVPFVGLLWDKKVKSFGNLTGRSEFYFDPDTSLDPDLLLDLFQRSLELGVDPDRHRALREECLESTRKMLAAIAARVEAQQR